MFCGIGSGSTGQYRTTGTVLAWHCRKVNFMLNPEFVEAKALRHAILLDMELNYQQVCFEGDCQMVIKVMQASGSNYSPVGAMVYEVKSY